MSVDPSDREQLRNDPSAFWPEGWARVSESVYEVSSRGAVRNAVTGRVLRPQVRRGYSRVELCLPSGRAKKRVHVLVLEAFVGPCPTGMESCHNNGDRLDNRVENLRWDTRRNNHADKVAHGTAQRGERVGNAKLNDAKVRLVRFLRAVHGARLSDLASLFGVSPRLISLVCVGRSWPHIPLQTAEHQS